MRARLGLGALLTVGLLAVTLCGGALGYFSSTGSGSASAAVRQLTAPELSAKAEGETVTLTWNAVSGPGTISYYVTRNGGTPGGTCPTSAAPKTEVTTCTETVGPGTYSYTVTAKYRTWTATSSPASVKISVGPPTHFVLGVSTTTPTAGTTVNLTITATDAFGSTATSYTGSKSLTFSGAGTAPGNPPTVTNSSGTAVAFGTATTIAFTNGVATVSGSSNGVMKLYKSGTATINVSDGSLEGEPDPTLTVAPAALAKLTLSAATTTPVAGVADSLTTTAYDTYANVATNYTGSHSLKYSGPSNSPNGTVPTVTDSSGNQVAFGTATPTEFVEGVATVGAGNNGAMRLPNAAAASIKVTEGSISSATITVTPTPASAAALTITPASKAPTAGGTDNLKTTAVDAYGNTATSYTGSHSITFSGAEASPSGTLATVTNASGTAVNVGSPTALTFTAGAASVSSTSNGVLKPVRSGTMFLNATDGTISTATGAELIVAAGTAAKLAWYTPTVSIGTLSSPCLFSCTITALGNSGTFTGKVAVTDSLGNVASAVGTGHTVSLTVSGVGSITSGSSLTIASTGSAISTASFTYKAKSSGAYTDTITAARTAGTEYSSATATANR